jgi:L-amino acid N-acyltransferase YncA
MEIIAEPGVVSYRSSDISNKVKGEIAALGFRVKFGWTSAVLLTGEVGNCRNRCVCPTLLEMKIRAATKADRDAIWKIFHEVVAAGDTYALDPCMSREEALSYWFGAGTETYVAESAGQVAGTYILRPNQSGGGSHIANAAFMVAPDARGHGIGRAMGEHCLSEARQLGFRAMQFNFVISTNESAVRLWEELGFTKVGTLPAAFRHPEKGYVDAYVMFRSLL